MGFETTPPQILLNAVHPQPQRLLPLFASQNVNYYVLVCTSSNRNSDSEIRPPPPQIPRFDELKLNKNRVVVKMGVAFKKNCCLCTLALSTCFVCEVNKFSQIRPVVLRLL